MSVEKKRQFVETTYKILKEEGLDGIRIRRLASELHCTSTVIYRYFEDLDHLIALASISILNDYLIDFRKLVSDPQILSDPYALNLRMWDCMAKYAFANMQIYEMLFFGKYADSLGEIIFEYYQLFLDEARQDFDGYSVSILFNDNMEQRDYVLLRRAAGLGIITQEAAKSLSKLEVYIFHGILMKYTKRCNEPGISELALKEFHDLLAELESKYRLK